MSPKLRKDILCNTHDFTFVCFSAEKSEVISDYQQEKEKRAETTRQVCKATRSKLGEYVRVNDGEFDKRLVSFKQDLALKWRQFLQILKKDYDWSVVTLSLGNHLCPKKRRL